MGLYIGADGEPLPNIDIDVGAYVATWPDTHPFHPLNL